MSRLPPRQPRTLYAVTIIILLLVVGLLVHVLRQFETDIRANVQGLQRMLSNETLLRDPSDPYIRFGPLEELVSKYAEHPYLREMTITKLFRDREDVVYPFYYPALQVLRGETTAAELGRYPSPERPASDTLKVPLVARGRLLGHLYVRIDRRPLQGVQLAVGSLTLLLLGFTGLYVAQFRRQAVAITRTTIELEEKRREIIRLERLALAGQLSASLLHDLKKPVLNIKNELGDILAENEQLPESLRNSLQLLYEQTQLFFAILHSTNIERFVRGEAAEEYADVNQLIETSIALVHYERGQVELKLSLAPSLPCILVQPVQLVQVFSNIILNAYQAMNGRGVLTIRSCLREDWIVVEFSDTGRGIPPSELDKIFAPFYSTKREGEGTGLGLYISRDIVRHLGGEIRVQSSEKGTTFTVEIPARKE
ncbi:MAG: ATP-binding protein [Candidatus Sumerlaeaceae bacterium]|nr:ATP-binding protein [Candidatus Sumerlaeaceae bacterium]